MKMQTVIVLGVLLVVLHINVGDATSCSRLMCPQGHVCAHSGWRLAMRLMEYECLLSTPKGTEAYLPHTVGQENDVICLQETQGKDQFLQAIHVLQTQFRKFGTFTPEQRECWRVGSSCP